MQPDAAEMPIAAIGFFFVLLVIFLMILFFFAIFIPP
jgi:hypothetical protein